MRAESETESVLLPQSTARPYALRLAAANDLLDQGCAAAAAQQAVSLCIDFPALPGGFVLHARCATTRGDWPEALLRWQACRLRFPGAPAKWRMGLAHALLNTGDTSGAAIEFANILEKDPHAVPAMAGLAQSVTATDPHRAMKIWQDILIRFPERAQPTWRVALARLCLAQGQAAQAEATLRSLLAETPAYAPARALMLHALIEAGDKPAAALELQSGLFCPRNHATASERLRLQTWLGHTEDAHASFFAAVQTSNDPTELTSLFNTIPQIFGQYDRREIWRALRVRLDRTRDPGFALLLLRLDIALGDYETFLRRQAAAPPLPDPWGHQCARLAAILRAPQFPDFAAPRIFGIGLTKTGTSSLGRALETLGYAQAHFVNPFTQAILAEEDFALFDAVTDTPASLRFETLYYTYPNAKFVLSERPFATWQKSFDRHFQRSDNGYEQFQARATQRGQCRHGSDLARLHAGLYFAHADLRGAWDSFQDRVARFFADKPGKLLRHNVFTGDGWPTLCRFLGREQPATDYPWLNQAD
jgi:hypothetical protein